MGKYALYYYDIRGRAEAARLMFVAAGVDFEDIRYTREEWPQHKTEMPFGQLPVIAVNGQKFGQSIAIFNYVARELGFHGKTSLESLAVDEVVQLQTDMILAGVKFFREEDPERKEQFKKVYVEEEVPKYLEYFCDLLKKNDTGYFVGSSLTLADFLVYEWLNSHETTGFLQCVRDVHGPSLAAKYPEIQRLNDAVLSNDKVKAYVESRKPSMY